MNRLSLLSFLSTKSRDEMMIIFIKKRERQQKSITYTDQMLIGFDIKRLITDIYITEQHMRGSITRNLTVCSYKLHN